MPNWKKLIVSGSDAALRTVTASVFLATTGSNNIGFQGTASWAQNALTASFLLGGASGTPGGADTTIQFNDSNTFSGSNNFTFNKSISAVQITGSLLVFKSLDTSNRYLINSNGSPLLDWESGALYDGAGIASTNIVFDLVNRAFYGLTGDIIDIGIAPGIYSSNTSQSIDWNTRNLLDQNANTVLSWLDINANNAVRLYGTSSLALTASFVNTLKAGTGSAASFGGSPRTGSITFSSAFSNNNYAVTVTGEDARSWTIENKSSTGFRINSNSTTALTGPVYWIATPFNS